MASTVKLTVTPAGGEPADTLDDLADLLRRAQQQVAADEPTGPAQPRARVRLALNGRVKAVELSW